MTWLILIVFFLKRKTQKNRKLEDIIFNLGFENLSIINMAERIKKTLKLKSKILIKPSNDPRSYRQNSDRILKKGFKPKKNIADAIFEIKNKFDEKKIKKEIKYFRVNTLKIIKAK